MNARERLIKAKALIATPDRWCKKHARNFNGQRCALGAIWEADGENWKTSSKAPETEEASNIMVRVVHGDETISVANFNDDPKTTHQDIMAAFDLAIEEASR